MTSSTQAHNVNSQSRAPRRRPVKLRSNAGRLVAIGVASAMMWSAAHATPLYTDGVTVTEGTFGNRQSQGYGFFLGVFGSVSPTTTSTGLTYRYIEDIVSRGQPRSGYFAIQGLTSNPGSGWLQSLTCLGVEKTGASASYGYDSADGIAVWIWTSSFGFSASGTAQCTVVHE